MEPTLTRKFSSVFSGWRTQQCPHCSSLLVGGQGGHIRQGRDPQWASLLFIQLQKELESIQTTCSSVVGQHQTSWTWTRRAGVYGGFKKLTAQAKPRIPCTPGVSKEWLPLIFCRAWGIYVSLETPRKGIFGILVLHGPERSGVLVITES